MTASKSSVVVCSWAFPWGLPRHALTMIHPEPKDLPVATTVASPRGGDIAAPVVAGAAVVVAAPDGDYDTDSVESPVEMSSAVNFDAVLRSDDYSTTPFRDADDTRFTGERCATCCGCACVLYTVLVPFFWLTTWFTITNGRSGYDHEVWGPGDSFRRTYRKAIVKGLTKDDWAGVERGLGEVENHAAVIIGDASGELFSANVGWIRANQRMCVASASKLIAALAVHRIAARTAFSVDDPVSAYVDAWEDADGGRTTRVSHLLGFTTGFTPMPKSYKGGDDCVRPPTQNVGWGECVNEISRKERKYAPGMSYLYGPWHLVVAGYVALKAAGRPATHDAWIRTVENEVYRPSEVWATPEWPGINADAPWFFPFWGTMYLEQDFRFPDLAGGLRISGRQYGKILSALLGHRLLSPTDTARFFRDRTENVSWWENDLGGHNGVGNGYYHYVRIAASPSRRSPRGRIHETVPLLGERRVARLRRRCRRHEGRRDRREVLPGGAELLPRRPRPGHPLQRVLGFLPLGRL